MANAKILEAKQSVIDEVKNNISNHASSVWFEYRGLTDNEAKELRKTLRDNSADYKVYKNTLMNRALKDLNVDLGSELTGPSALAFGTDQIAAIKILTDFAKTHPSLVLKVGIVDGEVADKSVLDSLSQIPSRDGLLTMLAGGMIGLVRDLSICLDLYAEEK